VFRFSHDKSFTVRFAVINKTKNVNIHIEIRFFIMPHLLLVLNSENAQNTGDFTVNFNPPLDFGQAPHLATMRHLSMYNSWYNISTARANRAFRYYNGTAWKDFNFDEGSFSIQSFQEELQDRLVANGDATLNPDGSYDYDIHFMLDPHNGYVDLVLTNSYQVDFSVSNLHQLLGFSNIIYTASATSPNQANITGGVSTLLIHFSPVSGSSRINNSSSDILYVISSAQSAPNSLIDITGGDHYLPVSNRISQARVYITDENLNPINLNGAAVNLTVYISPV